VEIETIPSSDFVSRHLFEPSMRKADRELVWENVFMFQSKNSFKESIVWRRYAPTIEQVHALGCSKQYNDQEIGKKTIYIGALTANAGSILGLKSKNGFQYAIVHDPSDGQGIHHAHVQFDISCGEPGKNDKLELKVLLKDVFSQIENHSCPCDKK
jgi:hypothetical protein